MPTSQRDRVRSRSDANLRSAAALRPGPLASAWRRGSGRLWSAASPAAKSDPTAATTMPATIQPTGTPTLEILNRSSDPPPISGRTYLSPYVPLARSRRPPGRAGCAERLNAGRGRPTGRAWGHAYRQSRRRSRGWRRRPRRRLENRECSSRARWPRSYAGEGARGARAARSAARGPGVRVTRGVVPERGDARGERAARRAGREARSGARVTRCPRSARDARPRAPRPRPPLAVDAPGRAARAPSRRSRSSPPSRRPTSRRRSRRARRSSTPCPGSSRASRGRRATRGAARCVSKSAKGRSRAARSSCRRGRARHGALRGAGARRRRRVETASRRAAGEEGDRRRGDRGDAPLNRRPRLDVADADVVLRVQALPRTRITFSRSNFASTALSRRPSTARREERQTTRIAEAARRT